jgi:hypothetical protein
LYYIDVLHTWSWKGKAIFPWQEIVGSSNSSDACVFSMCRGDSIKTNPDLHSPANTPFQGEVNKI